MSHLRDIIITTMRNSLEQAPNVLALWLEGADATGSVDQYSDIDLCCSVEAGTIEAVTARAQDALNSLGKLDIVEKSAHEIDFQSATFHLEDTSSYLLIDFDVYVGRGSQFIEGDAIEKPLILFDRAGVIRFVKPDEQLATINRSERLLALANIAAQYSRIEKYIYRGDFLEAYGYYHKWLLTPLIEVLRIRYTPLHPDYYIVHISQHLPAGVLHRLEDLFKINSLVELETKSRNALSLFEETIAFLRLGNA